MKQEPDSQEQRERDSVRLLVIGGTPEDRSTVQAGFSGSDEPRFSIDFADSPESVLAQGEAAPPGAIVLDLSLPDSSYAELRQRVRERWPQVPIVLLADPPQEALAWNAVRDGAQDYLVRGRTEPELIWRVVRNAIERQRLIAELEHRVTQLEPSEARFRRVIAQNADGIVIVDDAGTIRFINPAAEALFGRAAEQLVGELFGFPVVTGETTEIDVVRRGGELITAELRAANTVWEGEKACLISLRDITDRKRAEQRERELIREQAARAAAEAAEQRSRRLAEENARLYQEAQVANNAKSNFLAVMSHELRTPLNAIIGYTDLLLAGVAGELTEQLADYLGRIQTSSQHLLELVEEVLTFSRVEAGREEVSPERVDIGELLREVAAISEPLAAKKGIAFSVEPPGEPLLGVTDPAKLRQVLLNLCANAVKFTEQGQVRIDCEQDGDSLVLSVTDTGIGIPPELQEMIFEPFWQASPGSTRTRGGTGLGLTVSRRLAQLLGGEVEVESEEGRGSTFRVRLPLKANPAAE